MLAIKITFPEGKYHFLLGGGHLNDAGLEWPFSPWRFLRALICVWHVKLRDISEDKIRSLIELLCRTLPCFWLPDQGNYFILGWPELELTDEQKDLLANLLFHLGYPGRAEFRAEAAIEEHWQGQFNVFPWPDQDRETVVRLIAPFSDDEYQLWKQGFMAALSGRKNLHLPEDVFSCLHADTTKLRQQGWNYPPGSRMVDYYCSSELFKHIVQPVLRTDNPGIACFALYSEVPPLLTRVLQVTEKLHQTLVSLSDGHPVFTGKDEQGCPLQKGHEHTYIFCRADKTGRIERVILYARQGFDKSAQEVFYRLKKVWARGAPDLYFTLLYTGHLKDFQNDPFFAKARTWISYTPFVPTRHPRYNRNGKPRFDPDGLHQGSPEHDLCRLLQLEGKPKPVKIERVENGELGNKSVSWVKFKTERKKGAGRRAGKRGYGFRIEFDREVQGPLAVGYGAHFGLGVFVPEGEGGNMGNKIT